MNHNPLTNFEYMHSLIDETPLYVSMNKFLEAGLSHTWRTQQEMHYGGPRSFLVSL